MLHRIAGGHPSRWERLLPLWCGIMCLGFALRALSLDTQSFWRDEVDALLFAQRDIGVLLGNFVKVGDNGPLYFLGLHFWVLLTGPSEFALRFSSLFFGVLTVAVLGVLARRLFNRQVGLLAGLVAAVAPYYVWYAQEAKMYSLLTFLTVLSWYAYLRALDGNGTRWWLAVAGINSLALYVHFFAPLIVVAEAVAFVPLWRTYRHRWRPWVWCFGAQLLPYVPLALWQLPMLQQGQATIYPFVSPEGILGILIQVFSFYTSPLPGVVTLSGFLFAALVALLLWPANLRAAVSGRPGWLGSTALLVVLALAPVAGYYLVTLKIPLFTDRYLILVSPAYYLLLALGLWKLWRTSIPVLTVTAVLLVATVAHSLFWQATNQVKADFRGAAAYYGQVAGGEEPVVFLMPYVERSFSHYHGRAVRTIVTPDTNSGMSEEQLGVALRNQISGSSPIWLVVSEPGYHDARGITQEWFERNGRLLAKREFTQIKLYRYGM